MNNPIKLNLDIKSETVEKAMDLISRAGYILYEPTRIRRKAQADSDADLIKAKGEVELTELQFQAYNRLTKLEILRQKNINTLTEKALKNISSNEKAIDQETDTDWIRKYFSYSQDISNEDMQKIWSNILAGELTSSGSYSYKTLSILANMRKEDAEIFSRLCSYTAKINKRKVPLVFSDRADGLFNNGAFNFEQLQYLESLGLVHFNNISSFSLTVTPAQEILIQSGADYYVLKSEEQTIKLSVGDILLTREGQELFDVLDINTSNNLVQMIEKHWVTGNRSLSKVQIKK